MLVPYKQEYEKIAMGLLSFMPDEKKVKHLQQTIEQYKELENAHLYLWKEESYIGVIGVETCEEGIFLKDLSVNPSYRNEGIATKMIDSLEEKLNVTLQGSKYTKEFLDKCRND
ncbi:GNAT family N-acetyltransferase [Bacillus shivajii]|uniref:GNAT family N-acetyltransferase n=1 Tax=Bacillus shivajii TaxID=1983719 RepID=UPI001CFA9F82|nr:GNAT family N-acetyltransferase [Bacillus shivajii]UCZ54707.1 GNAT family N-acetyltransferase [Bacillus shivajii]